MHLIGSKSDLLSKWKIRLSILQETLNSGLKSTHTIERIQIEISTLEKCILELEALCENKKELYEKGILCAKK